MDDQLARALFSDSPEPQLVVDAALTIVDANAALLARFGLTRDAIGRDVRDALPDRTDLHASLARAAKGTIDVTPIESEARGRSTPILSGGAVRWIVHRIEDAGELARATERVAAELDAFRYAVSHDLRFPLRVIDGFSRAVEEDYAAKLDDEGRSFLASIHKGVGRLETMIARLDELLRLASVPMTIVDLDLSALAHEAVAAVRQQRTHAVALEIADGLTARGDRRLVEIALAALIDNAWKFTSRTEQPRVVVGRDDRGWFVRDNGVGFDSNAARLFSPFRRMHAADEFPGDGVGLARVHRVVARHGGRVWADAKPGEGATLYFTLG